MITFDKLKIVSKLQYIDIIKIDEFDKDKMGNLIYKQTKPFTLTIKVNYKKSELFIEFTGKILGKQYPQLISIDTIRQCFENINAIGICTADIDNLLYDSEVCACDVTTDVECKDIAKVCAYMRNNVSSYRKYTPRQLRNGNFIINKNVTTKTYMKKLTIYDKEQEIQRTENKGFMDSYGIDASHFRNKCRFELTLNSKEQIRNALNIEDTGLMSVLKSTATPISDFVNEILTDDIPSSSITSFQDYIVKLVLKDCHDDMEEVEAKLRQFYAKGNNMSKILAPYRTALNNRGTDGNENMKKTILGLIVSK